MTIHLQSKRVTLAPFESDDLKDVCALLMNAPLMRYKMHYPLDSVEEVKSFIEKVSSEIKKENPTFFDFKIVVNNTFAGRICLYQEENNMTEIGWSLKEEMKHQGIAFEAANLLLSFAKEHRMNHIYADIDERNIPSQNLALRLGMKHVKTTKRKNKQDSIETNNYVFIKEL